MQVVGCLVILAIFIIFGSLIFGSCIDSCGCDENGDVYWDCKSKGGDSCTCKCYQKYADGEIGEASFHNCIRRCD